MGALAWGGAISGAGQQMGQGLLNMQSGFIQQGLMEEREKMEQARQQAAFAHEDAREVRGYQQAKDLQQGGFQHAETLQQQGFTHAEGLNQQTTGTQITLEGMRANATKEQHETDHQYDERKVSADEKRADAEEKRAQAYADLAGRRGDATAPKENYTVVIERARRLGGNAMELRKEAAKLDVAGASPAEIDQAKALRQEAKRYDRLAHETEMSVLNGKFDIPDSPEPDPSAKIKNPFPMPGAQSGIPTVPGAAHAATIPTPSAPPQRTNVVREGKQQLQAARQALQEAQSTPNLNPSTLQQLQQTVTDLEARWGR